MVDDSGSIRDRNVDNDDGSDNFETIATVLRRIVAMVNIGFDKTRVALLRFSDLTEFEFQLNDYTTVGQYDTAIANMIDNFKGGNTNTTGGLFKARTEALIPANGERPSVSNVVMVITDGQATIDADNMELQAASLKNMPATTVVAVGVTEAVDRDTLAKIATGDNIFHVTNFQDLQNSDLLGVLADDLCQDSAITK